MHLYGLHDPCTPRGASTSPHSPAQPHIIQRYGCSEYVGVVGAG